MKVLIKLENNFFSRFILSAFLLFLCSLTFAKNNCTKTFELSTKENTIVDQCGNYFKLKSVNWYGAHDVAEVVGGLDKQPLKNIVLLIKRGGFNSVRLPFSNDMIGDKKIVDPKYIAANPELKEKTPLQIFDIVVKALTDAGIVVILNNHTTLSQWCCGYDYNSLWYHPDYQSVEKWISDWTYLASRYRDNPLVAGADLRNEVRTGHFYKTVFPIYPNWGKGGQNDWKSAAKKAGDAIHQINPNLLIIVEGINWTGIPIINGHRPLLTPIKDSPLVLDHPNKLVYEVHVYGYTGPTHTGDDSSSPKQMRYRDMDEATLKSTFDSEFGYVLEKGQRYTAPVWLGEFGVGSEASEQEQVWFQHTANYLIEKEMGWGFWSLNPEHVDGTPEGYGLLNDTWTGYRNDWRNASIERLLQS